MSTAMNVSTVYPNTFKLAFQALHRTRSHPAKGPNAPLWWAAGSPSKDYLVLDVSSLLPEGTTMRDVPRSFRDTVQRHIKSRFGISSQEYWLGFLPEVFGEDKVGLAPLVLPEPESVAEVPHAPDCPVVATPKVVVPVPKIITSAQPKPEKGRRFETNDKRKFTEYFYNAIREFIGDTMAYDKVVLSSDGPQLEELVQLFGVSKTLHIIEDDPHTFRSIKKFFDQRGGVQPDLQNLKLQEWVWRAQMTSAMGLGVLDFDAMCAVSLPSENHTRLNTPFRQVVAALPDLVEPDGFLVSRFVANTRMNGRAGNNGDGEMFAREILQALRTHLSTHSTFLYSTPDGKILNYRSISSNGGNSDNVQIICVSVPEHEMQRFRSISKLQETQ